jgi:hypothetical protein
MSDKPNKTSIIRARVTKDVKQRWVEICEFEGVNESEMLRRVIMQIPVIGSVNSETSKVVLVSGDDCMTIEEELKRR